MKCKQVDIGDKCIECMRSTVFGTGLFVNRLPADNDKYIGYLCPECNFHECDRCNEKIYCDRWQKLLDHIFLEEESDYEKYKDDPRNLANDPRFKHLQKEDSNEDS